MQRSNAWLIGLQLLYDWLAISELNESGKKILKGTVWLKKPPFR